VMPYCNDEDDAPHAVTPRMPHADEVPPMPGAAEACELPEHADHPDCQEDAHYNEHYPGVPYVCPPVQSVPHSKMRSGECLPGQEECSEPDAPAPRLHKAHYPSKGIGCEGCPVHPEVDTMEYRKSDGGLNEYGPGGPL